MPPLWSRELKWAVVASLMAHGVALAWLPMQGLPPPASPPPLALEVRLQRPAAPHRAAPAAARIADKVSTMAAVAPPSLGSRAESELAEPMPAPFLARAETYATPVARLSSATTPAMATTIARYSEATPSDALDASGAVAEPARAALLPGGHTFRQASVSAPIGLPGTTGGPPADAEPSVDAQEQATFAPRMPPTPALRHSTTRSADAAGALSAWPTTASGPPARAEGERVAQAHARDKTPWQAAQPAWAPGAALPASPPQPAVAADASSGDTRPGSAETIAPEPLRVASAAALSLLEAEDAPSSAIAIARLTATSRACFAAPPAQWKAQGRVLLRIRVDISGRPVEVMLDSGSGEPRLDRLALAQARDCARFEILDRQGRPRAAVVRLPVVYRFAD